MKIQAKNSKCKKKLIEIPEIFEEQFKVLLTICIDLYNIIEEDISDLDEITINKRKFQLILRKK